MTNAHRHPIGRSSAVLAALALATSVLAACGDDDDATGAGSDEPTAEAASAPDEGSTDAEFCEGFLGLEAAFAEAPEDEAEIPAFVQQRIDPNLALIEGNEPAAIAEDVQTMTAAVTEVTSTGDFSAFETPEFLAASESVYGSLDDTCDVEVVEFRAIDYGYEGLPATLPAGATSFVMSNESEAGEAHEFVLVKLSDDTDLSIQELLEMPEAEAEQHIDTFAGGTFAPAGATAGTVTELSPGRWAYVCFIPVGSVGDTEGSGPPHFVEGMAGELTVD
ncbi:hypothetical protein NHL50_03575 [Acidimicrobiia bacterium EGI L10123]|uniref:hypothetical protein n=1 Tax=Salinilacustrithrix flava TaxID=2957203 RepID=UPI003D7C310A|nr:hypothetical protein [Acidimicrobiia bacterium EGI L10123]